jgi:hypothetical protein
MRRVKEEEEEEEEEEEAGGHVRSQLVHDSTVIRAYAHAKIGRVQMLSPGVGWGRWRQCARQQLCVGCVER